jgi:hypothetical protein
VNDQQLARLFLVRCEDCSYNSPDDDYEPSDPDEEPRPRQMRVRLEFRVLAHAYPAEGIPSPFCRPRTDCICVKLTDRPGDPTRSALTNFSPGSGRCGSGWGDWPDFRGAYFVLELDEYEPRLVSPDELARPHRRFLSTLARALAATRQSWDEDEDRPPEEVDGLAHLVEEWRRLPDRYEQSAELADVVEGWAEEWRELKEQAARAGSQSPAAVPPSPRSRWSPRPG